MISMADIPPPTTKNKNAPALDIFEDMELPPENEDELILKKPNPFGTQRTNNVSFGGPIVANNVTFADGSIFIQNEIETYIREKE